MILVINCMLEEAFALDFDRVIAQRMKALGQSCRFCRPAELTSLQDLSGFTHLLLSGSEASTTVNQAWDPPLADLVRRFVGLRRPILGICYGHQFLAKTLAGPGHVRRAKKPEFGWLRPRLEPSPLFRGLSGPEFMVCHFDEVADLPEDFTVLASSDRCAIHAFQYRDLPVWGVQFHPEYGPDEARPIFQVVCRDCPELIPPPPGDLSRLRQRAMIFENFIQAG